jgi:hypothetical protein
MALTIVDLLSDPAKLSEVAGLLPERKTR